MSRPKIVFIAHPISGDVEGNLSKVAAICRQVHSVDVVPVFPSFTWRRYLTDSPEDRALARAVNEAYFRRGFVDEVWFFGDRLSDGMRQEALLAIGFRIPVIGKTPETKRALAELASSSTELKSAS